MALKMTNLPCFSCLPIGVILPSVFPLNLNFSKNLNVQNLSLIQIKKNCVSKVLSCSEL